MPAPSAVGLDFVSEGDNIVVDCFPTCTFLATTVVGEEGSKKKKSPAANAHQQREQVFYKGVTLLLAGVPPIESTE